MIHSVWVRERSNSIRFFIFSKFFYYIDRKVVILNYFFNKKANIIFSSLMLIVMFVATGKVVTASTSIPESEETAKYQGNLGAYYWQKGEIHQALSAWSQAAEIYRLQGLGDKEAETILKISQGYTNLGQFRLAIFQLEKLLSSAKEPSLIARTWEKLGNAYSRSGDFSKAISAYHKSLGIEQSLSTLNNLVVLLQKQNLQLLLQADSSRKGEETQRYRREAQFYVGESLKYAEQALLYRENEESSSSVRALIEWAKVSPTGLSAEHLERGRRLLSNLSSSRTKVFLAINWAKLDSQRASYWLFEARKVAEAMEDELAESYALLELGFLSEKSGNFPQALEYAQLARQKAESRLVFDSLYQSQWLSGRIYQKTGNLTAATVAYRDSIASLDALNQGFTNISVERRMDFKTEIEPIYRELLALLLNSSNPSESSLAESLLVFDKLRLAQLHNYFGDNCFEIEREARSVENTLAGKNAVLLNSIILENQTHFILQLPDGTLHHSQAEISKAEITKLANDWYKTIKTSYGWQTFSPGQDLYNLIIRPLAKELESANPSTIIFVHDGVLRNLPMAALYDGENFLAQKWASVSSIGLNFVSTANREKKPKALAFGLGVARDEWSKLAHVEQEVENVIDIVGGEKFLDEDFTSDNFVKELEQGNYSVLHLATHGYFGGVAENSFILAYDRPLSALELEASLARSKTQITLLVISACETAISSERSALGLAGVALRSGVDSVLGSFWQVQDDVQLELMEAFYANFFTQNLGLAEIVQRIQIEQIKRKSHPSNWAALNLLGDF